MKTKLLFILLITFINPQLYSQDYEPILKKGSFWDIKEESWDFNSSSEITCLRRKRIEVNGDTTINNKIYKKLKQAYFAEINGLCTVKTPFTINKSNFKPIDNLFLREDISKKRLYILAEVNDDDFKEFTLCDFNLKIGDTLENYYLENDNSEYTITISDISINENNKKVFHTSSGHTYTEGIGRNDNVLVPYNLITEGLIESVFCHGFAQNQNDCATVVDNSTYDPVIKEGAFWDVVHHPNANWPSTANRYKVKGDTIINDNTYKKLFTAPLRQSDDFLELPNGLDNLYINQTEFVEIRKYIRENIQEKKVYILEYDNNTNTYNEYTYCDFNLNVGDTMEDAYLNNSEMTIEISQINISSYNGKNAYHINGQFLAFVEGVGKFSYPFESYDMYYALGTGYSEIFCNGNDENQNNCTEVLSTKKNELSSVKIYPNPIKDILTIHNTENSTVKIYSVNGSLLKTVNVNSNFEIDVSSFASGIYFLEVSNLKGKQRKKVLKL